MTDRTTLLALADRCEQAAGPDRELDAEIVAAITHGVVGMGDETPDDDWLNRLYQWEPPRVWGDSWLPVPTYTASLDAAVTLYPVLPEVIPSCPRKASAAALRARAAMG